MAVAPAVPAASTSDPAFIPKPVSSTFTAFPKATLVDSRVNEADTLRLRIGNDEYVFELYFIDALEASWTHPEIVASQARWFGGVANETIVNVGQEAMVYVRELLQGHPFTVLTRWERVPDSSRYYALILVEHQPGQQVYLADLLLHNGYARIGGQTTQLPEDRRRLEAYLDELKTHSRYAKEKHLGIWAYGKS